MKIVTVTYSRSYNFGANLQAYALQKFLRQQGHTCQIIDTRVTPHRPVAYRKDPKGLLVNLFTYWNRDKLDKGNYAFENFNYGEDDRTENYADYARLYTDPPQAEAFISGSDQVFTPNLMSPLYFLDFVPTGKKRISYAASIGVNQIPADKKEQFAAYLKAFDYISVREKNAADLIKSLIDRPVEVHVDPVFLLDAEEWKKVEKPVAYINKPYILCYFMYRPPGMNQMLKRLHKETGLDIVLVDTTAFRNIYNNKLVLDAGPQEFLWLLHHAEKVVTSSFHGTALSIVYGKEFCTVNNAANPSRINQLADVFSLHDHLVTPSDIGGHYPLDRRRVARIIKDEQARSASYLKRALHS